MTAMDDGVPKLGLALGGGVAHGWAHLGVLRRLDEAGIRPDVVAGTSIGAMVGACYLAGKLDALEAWARSLTRLRVVAYMDFTFSKPGIIGGGHLEQAARDHLGALRVEDLDRPFVAIAVDMFTGHEVWLREGDLVTATMASYAMPGVFPPVRVRDFSLVDGALVNPVPVSVCRALGARLVIAVNLQTDSLGKARVPGTDYQRVAGYDLQDVIAEKAGQPSLFSPLTGRITKLLGGMLFGREENQPSTFGVMFSSLSIVLDRITRSRLAGDPPDVQIGPKLGAFGLAEFQRAAEMIDIGYATTDAMMPEIQESLEIAGCLRTLESRTGPNVA